MLQSTARPRRARERSTRSPATAAAAGRCTPPQGRLVKLRCVDRLSVLPWESWLADQPIGAPVSGRGAVCCLDGVFAVVVWYVSYRIGYGRDSWCCRIVLERHPGWPKIRRFWAYAFYRRSIFLQVWRCLGGMPRSGHPPGTCLRATLRAGGFPVHNAPLPPARCGSLQPHRRAIRRNETPRVSYRHRHGACVCSCGASLREVAFCDGCGARAGLRCPTPRSALRVASVTSLWWTQYTLRRQALTRPRGCAPTPPVRLRRVRKPDRGGEADARSEVIDVVF